MARRKKGAQGKGERFLRLPHILLKSEAWRSLSPAQRCVYIAIGEHYTGFNNGRIGLSVRQAAELANVNKDTAGAAFRVLEERGLIRKRKEGGFSYKVRHATEWVLTAHPSGLNGEHPATQEFRHWKPQEKSRSPRSGQTVP